MRPRHKAAENLARYVTAMSTVRGFNEAAA